MIEAFEIGCALMFGIETVKLLSVPIVRAIRGAALAALVAIVEGENK